MIIRKIGKVLLIMAGIILLSGNITYADNNIDRITKNNIEQRINNLILYSNPKLNSKERNRITTSIIRYSRQYNLDPMIVASIGHVESNFEKKLVQPGSHCRGILQVNCGAHKEKLHKRGIKPKDLHDVKNNIDVGCEIYGEILKQCGGNNRKALLRFVGSKRATWYPKKVMKVYHKFS